jgi:phenylalanyl-tRNA synthetase beta chain
VPYPPEQIRVTDAVSAKREYFDRDGRSYLMSGRGGEFLCGESTIAAFGQASENLRREYKLRHPAWLAEIDLERLLEYPLRSKTFHAFSKFPPVQRDFSLLIPNSVSYGQIAERIDSLAASEILRFLPIDLFRGSAIESGHYGLLLRATFQSHDHTLTGEEISAASQRVLDTLTPLGIRLRR